MIDFKLATTPQELNEVFKLRYKVFVEEDQKFNPAAFSNQMMFDEYDTYKETHNIVVRHEGEYIATVRTTVSTGDDTRLSCDHFHDGYRALRMAQPGKYSSVGMLAVSKKNCSVKVLYGLIKSLIALGNEHKVDYALFPVNFRMQKTLERLGAVLVDKIEYNEEVGNHIAPMMLEIKKTAQRFGIEGYYTH